jgi:sugar phosphate isomerase/epimerase
MPSGSRRSFIKLASAAAAAAAAAAVPTQAALAASAMDAGSPAGRMSFPLGVASYSLRKFPLEQALAMTARVGLTRVSLKDMHFPLTVTESEAAAVVALVKAAGLELSTIGVVYMTTEEIVRRAFSVARWAGIRFIVGVPGAPLMPLVERLVTETGIGLAIHNHGPDPQLYGAPEEGYRAVEKLDRRIGLCLDVGHTRRLGLDPAAEFTRFFDRIIDVHIKDVSAADKNGSTVEIGRGVVDIPALLRAALKLRYAGTFHFEHEKDAADPLPGLAESVGWVRGYLASL